MLLLGNHSSERLFVLARVTKYTSPLTSNPLLFSPNSAEGSGALRTLLNIQEASRRSGTWSREAGICNCCVASSRTKPLLVYHSGKIARLKY